MIIAVCLMIAAGLFYRYSSIQGQISSEEIQARFPTFEATNFNGQMFDQDGLLKYTVSSEDLVYYQDKGRMEMVKPVGFFFDHASLRDVQEQENQEAQESSNIKPSNLLSKYANSPFNYWTISADQGYMIHNTEAVLEGNVNAIPSDPEEEIQLISTPHMRFDMVANTVSSESEILLQGKQFIDQGKNYTLDLQAKTFVIKEKPHAVYYP